MLLQDLIIFQLNRYLGSVHNIRSLRYACSQNGHLRHVNSHFSSCASLDGEYSDPDPDFIGRPYLGFAEEVRLL